MAYLIPTTMAEVEIGFVTGLEAKDSVTKNLLTSLHNVQTPISSIIERDTLGIGVSTCHVSRRRLQLGTNQGTNRR